MQKVGGYRQKDRVKIIQNIIDVIKSKELIELIIAAGILVVFVLGSSWIARLICKLFKVKKTKLKENAIYKNLKTPYEAKRNPIIPRFGVLWRA